MKRKAKARPAREPRGIGGACKAAALNPPDFGSPDAAAGGMLLTEKYREALQQHLNHLPALFRSFTGLSCRVTWAPAWPHQWSERDLPIGFPLCRCLIARDPTTAARCRRCAVRHLKLTLQSGHMGHRFTCYRGVHNCWQPVIVRHCMVGLAFIQAFDTRARQPTRTPQSMPAISSSCATTAASRRGRACRTARRMTRADFNRSSKLMQLILEHAESLTLADLRKADLSKAQQALQELQTVATHLREDLNGLIPAVNRTVPVIQEKTHSEQIVHDVLDFICRNYAQPITLKQCARSLNLNASYVSALFSRHIGLPFKIYLTDLRMERARELLGDPGNNISDIAGSVGYASANRFRIAFKQATGLAPTAWRETLRMPQA